MASDPYPSEGEEPQRVLGLPVEDLRPHANHGEEPQRRVLGYPVGTIGPTPANREKLLSLLHHPIRTYKRGVRRRLGYRATDEDDV
jgi:hypothetical protein